MQKWRVLSSKPVASNPWVNIREDECLTGRDVHVASYFVVNKSSFVVAVAITKAGELLLVRQYKHPADEIVVECPAGYIEPGEDPAAAVVRELREETGYRPDKVRALGDWFASPATLSNRAHFFLCTGAELIGAPNLDATEDIELVRVPFAEVLSRVIAGDLVSDVASVAAILLAARALAEE